MSPTLNHNAARCEETGPKVGMHGVSCQQHRLCVRIKLLQHTMPWEVIYEQSDTKPTPLPIGTVKLPASLCVSLDGDLGCFTSSPSSFLDGRRDTNSLRCNYCCETTTDKASSPCPQVCGMVTISRCSLIEEVCPGRDFPSTQYIMGGSDSGGNHALVRKKAHSYRLRSSVERDRHREQSPSCRNGNGFHGSDPWDYEAPDHASSVESACNWFTRHTSSHRKASGQMLASHCVPRPFQEGWVA